MISGDEVQINKKGSMGYKPYYVSIPNVTGEAGYSEQNIECILGYSPDWLETKVFRCEIISNIHTLIYIAPILNGHLLYTP